MNWIKVKTVDGEVRFINMSHVLEIRPVVGGCAFNFGDFYNVYDVPVGEIEDALVQLSKQNKGSEQERWLNGE